MTTFNKMLTNLSQASVDNGGFVTLGYGQVEPNHLSAQRTGQIYAQLPAASTIDLLENGQFVKYDYAHGEVNFGTYGEKNEPVAGEWMLVFNEIKLYRDGQNDCEFAMKKGDYIARIYSPVEHAKGLDEATIPTRFYGGTGSVLKRDENGNLVVDEETGTYEITTGPIEKVTAPDDMYELHYNGTDPMKVFGNTKPAAMKDVNALVPRVFKTNVGDIFTTNMVKETALQAGDILAPKAGDGILAKNGDKASMEWQVVKVYTLPDTQKAVKLMRIK